MMKFIAYENNLYFYKTLDKKGLNFMIVIFRRKDEK